MEGAGAGELAVLFVLSSVCVCVSVCDVLCVSYILYVYIYIERERGLNARYCAAKSLESADAKILLRKAYTLNYNKQ